MSATHVIINLFGEVALLLWGIHMVHSGVLRAFGSNLRRFLAVGLMNRGRAFLAGLGTTTVLQSSTATALMATSFTADGMVGLVPALAVMLGANVGTTLIVQVVSFDINLVFPVFLFVGVVAYRRGGRTHTRDVGTILVGLGLMLLALHMLVQTVQPVENAPNLRELLKSLTSEPLLNIALAAAFTWAAHSSVATILLIMSLATAGVISVDAALAMVLGANLGSAINPVLEGTSGDPVKLRVPVGNLITRLVGCAAALPFLGWVVGILAVVEQDPARLVANFHTGFNLVLAALFILPLPAIAKVLRWLLPEKVRAADPSTPQYLDRAALETPTIALTNAGREVLRMSDVVEVMLRGSQDVFHRDDRQRIGEISRMDDILDSLHRAIHRYLAAIPRDALSDQESGRVSEILAYAINLEHVGDIIDKNLMELAAKKLKLRLGLAPDEVEAIDDMHQRLLDHLQLGVAVFMLGDTRAARRLVAEKEQFRDLERAATQRHFTRVREGKPDSVEASGLVLDIVRDLKRIEAHIAATAYPVLESSGELKPSRLVP